MPDFTCEEIMSWIENGEMHPERFPGAYHNRGGWKGWNFLSTLAAGSVTKIDPDCQCKLIEKLDDMKRKFESEDTLAGLSPEDQDLMRKMIEHGFSELDGDLSDGNITGLCSCEVYKRLSQHNHVNIRSSVANNSNLPLECRCDILAGIINDDRNKSYPWLLDNVNARYKKDCVDIYSKLDNGYSVLAGRKFTFLDIFEEETGRKADEFRKDPVEFSRLLNEHPRALHQFNSMMEKQREVDELLRQVRGMRKSSSGE